jgi:putative transposase
MIRAYKFLLRPTVRQDQALFEMLADHCSLHNGALQERRDAYRHVSKTSVTYGMQSAQLKDIRAFDPERQGRWSFSSQQATLRRLDKAFAAFFRRVKAGETPGYPRFRGVNWFDTVDFPRTATAAAGAVRRTTRSPGSASRASGMSRSTSTGR